MNYVAKAFVYMCIRMPPKNKANIVAGQKQLMMKDSVILILADIMIISVGIVNFPYERNLKKGIMGKLRRVLAANTSV